MGYHKKIGAYYKTAGSNRESGTESQGKMIFLKKIQE
jgi:hypothetical protein